MGDIACLILSTKDVVAQGGSAWIEVKSQELFGIDSVHWTGTQSVKVRGQEAECFKSDHARGRCEREPSIQGLRRQVQELLAVSQCESSQRRWKAPLVVLFFPSGVDETIQTELNRMGVYVAAGPGQVAACRTASEPCLPSSSSVAHLCCRSTSLSSPSTSITKISQPRVREFQFACLLNSEYVGACGLAAA